MAPIEHVERDGRRVAVVAGTDVTVEDIAAEYQGNRYAPADIAAKYRRVSVEEVEEAIDYYQRHQSEFDDRD